MRQTITTITRNTALAIAAVSILGACAADDAATTDSTAAGMSAMPAPEATPAAAATVTDPQIAAIVVAANTVDVEAGELAQSMSTNAKVKEFAAQMIRDHNAVNKQATDLVTRLNVTPETNPTSQSLVDGGRANVESLKTKTGAEFDKAYIANEVAYHQAVLDAIDNTLIPNAQNAELKTLLTQVRPAFAGHLQHAQTLQG